MTLTDPLVTPDSVGRRERKKQATRQALHDAAVDLVEERGLAGVTVEDITDRADVAVRTFFNHFPSKEEAVLERDPERAARIGAAVLDRPADEPPLTALHHVLSSEAFLQEITPAQMERRLRLIRSEPALLALMNQHFEDMVAEVSGAVGRRTGIDPATDLYPTLVTSASFMACRTAMMRWKTTDGSLSIADTITRAFDLLADGLVPPTPQEVRP